MVPPYETSVAIAQKYRNTFQAKVDSMGEKEPSDIAVIGLDLKC